MTIHEQQHAFLTDLGAFLQRAAAVCTTYGLAMAAGECWRTPAQAARNAAAGLGIRNSLHIDRLAFDLILKDRDPTTGHWRLLHAEHEAWRDLGTFWQSLRPEVNRWGASSRVFPEGNFARHHDPGHVSSTRGGVM